MGQRTPNLETLTDDQLDAHIGNLDSWLLFELADLTSAVEERERRGRGLFALTPEAERYLSDFGVRAPVVA